MPLEPLSHASSASQIRGGSHEADVNHMTESGDVVEHRPAGLVWQWVSNSMWGHLFVRLHSSPGMSQSGP